MPFARGPFAAGLGLLVGTACARPSPPPRQVRLEPAVATLPDPLSWVASVRELSDGRVVIADDQDDRLLVTDSLMTSVTEIARKGDGPGEFRALGAVWPLDGDSSLVVDRNQHRWIILVGITPVVTVGANDSVMRAVHSGFGQVIGTDIGHDVFAQAFVPRAAALPVEARLLRVDRSDGAIDTVATLATGAEKDDAAPAAAGPPVGTGRRQYVVPVRMYDDAAAFPDGWVAVARGDPYRVDWCRPHRGCRAGPTLEPDRRFTAREKVAYLVYTAQTTHWPPTSDIGETIGWPKNVPPFEVPSRTFPSSALTPLADGRLLVRRLPDADAPGLRYDLIDRNGERVGQIALPLNVRIVGAGKTSIYVVTIDKDELEHLTRIRWP